MTNRQRNNFIIAILLLAVVFMGVGYSLLSEELDVSGTTTIIQDKSPNISFSSLTYSLTDGAVNVKEPTFQGTSIYFDVQFSNPGAQASYKIILTNKGNIDMTVSSIIASSPSSPFIFQVYNIGEGEVIQNKTSREITVLIGWDENATLIEQPTLTDTFGLDIRFSQ